MDGFEAVCRKQDDADLVSIIIPSYNAELYIEECLDSLINQTYSALEIICVDDGSTDHTYHILETYRSKDKRIKLFKQEHLSAGAARNCGIKNASGKYLLFVDADDFCQLDMVEKLVLKAELWRTDILVFDLQHYDDSVKEKVEDSWTGVHIDCFGEGIKSAVDIKNTIFQFTISGPINKLFLHDFIVTNDIWFQPIPRTNDLFFVYASMTYADRIAVLNEKLQYYRINNPNSLQSTNEKSPQAFIEALQALKDNLVQRDVYSLFRESYEKMALSVAMFNLASQKSELAYRKVANAIRETIIANNTLLRQNMDESEKLQRLIRAAGDGEEIVIYGAGKVAEVLIKYLIYIMHNSQTKIRIMVTQKYGTDDKLCGINIIELEELAADRVYGVYVAAVDDKKAQRELISNLRRIGVDNTIAIGFDEVALLLGQV